MALFGDLVAAMAGRALSGLRTQVHQSMVPLLLHLKDSCPAVVTVSAHQPALAWARLRAGGLQMAVGLPDSKGCSLGRQVWPPRWFPHSLHEHTPVHTHVHTGQYTVSPANCCVPSAWPIVGAQVVH